MSGFYHLSVGIITRSKGQSAVACAAYRAGTTLRDERYGKIHDYQPRRGILDAGIELPGHAPQWMADRERLWNAVEAREKRKDSQLSREFNLAFPDQLNPDQRKELLRQFIRQEITDRGLAADWAIHAPNRAGDERNHHAHVMTSMRNVTPTGFGEMKARELNRPEQLIEWRKSWADLQNQAFERHQIRDEKGEIRKVDHRSYEAQGIVQEPTIHLGPHATAMERRGIFTELGDINRDVQAKNLERAPQRDNPVEQESELSWRRSVQMIRDEVISQVESDVPSSNTDRSIHRRFNDEANRLDEPEGRRRER